MVEIKARDVVEFNNDGWFYSISILKELDICGKRVINKPTLVVDYEDCIDTYYSWVTTLEDIKHRVTAVYRKIDGELKLIWKKENEENDGTANRN